MKPEAGYKEVANYYDELWAKLEKESMAGINSRHRMILNKLKKAGLNSNSTLLEIGCGIGTLSSFIAKYVTNGKVTAVDISPSSVEFAKKKYSDQKNLEFLVSDMTNFNYDGKFQFILFPDVLEHIPVEAHANIFKTISGLVNETSKVLINLPNPRAARWFIKNKPELMQIIDLDIETDFIINTLCPNGFFLETKETYSLYIEEPEYEWFVFKVNHEYKTITKRSKSKILWNSIKLRLANIFS
ncbi:MAG: class I SAM-dependent methyltransferase [Bacteroidia bacterium]